MALKEALVFQKKSLNKNKLAKCFLVQASLKV